MSNIIKKIQAGTITYDIEPAQSAAIEVTNNAPTLSWGGTSTIATVDGTAITVKMPDNPNTWRGIQNNLTSTSTTDSLSANQGKVLNDKFANYLPKTTYEYNKEISFGSTGKLYIGAFPMYDSNITVEISATTSMTYNATLVIATQNIDTAGGGSITATVYGDATNTIAPNIYIGYASGSNKIHVYFSPQSWSKNLIHIQAVALAETPSDVCTSVDSIPSTANRQPTNALTANFQAKGDYLTSHQTIKQDGITGATVNRYGACSTAADTAAKAVFIKGGTFNLEAGARVTVKFANPNTASTPTLNVNSKGAKAIFHKGAQITSGTNKTLLAGAVDFIYDGTQWHLVGNYVDTNTTYVAATTTTAGLMSKDDKIKLNGIEDNANNVTVDTALSTTSTNPVQNKVINTALAGKASTATATQSAAGLMSSTDKAKLDNLESCGAIAYSTSNAATAVKKAYMPGFTLNTDQRIILYFFTDNTVTSGVKLNVNDTGDQTVYVNGSAANATNFKSGYYEAYYNGSYWRLKRISLRDIKTGTYGARLARNWSGWISFDHTFRTTPVVFTTLKNSNANISNQENLIRSITTTGFWCFLSQPSGSSSSNYNAIVWLAVDSSEPTPN